jgi:hypothetical protein
LSIYEKAAKNFSNFSRDHGVAFTNLNLSDLSTTLTNIVTLQPALDPRSIILDFNFEIRGPCDVQLSYNVITIKVMYVT